MLSRVRGYPGRIRFVLGLLLLQAAVPAAWVLLGALVPNTPLGAACTLGIMLPCFVGSITALVGLLMGKVYGKDMASISLGFFSLILLVIGILETIRFVTTPSLEILSTSAAIIGGSLSVGVLSALGVLWLQGKPGRALWKQDGG